MATSTSTGPSTSPKNTAAFTRPATPLASSRHPHKSLQWTCTQVVSALARLRQRISDLRRCPGHSPSVRTFPTQVFNPNFQTHIRSPLDLERGVLRGKSVLPTTAERTPSARLRRVRPSAVRQGLRRAIGRYRQVQPTT